MYDPQLKILTDRNAPLDVPNSHRSRDRMVKSKSSNGTHKISIQIMKRESEREREDFLGIEPMVVFTH